MTSLEKMLVRFVCEDAYNNKDENPYDIYVSLNDCYKSFSRAKEKAYYDCISAFSTDVRIYEELARRSFCTFTRILSHNTMTFTLLQGAYYFTKDGALIALFRYDTRTRVVRRAFRMSKDGLDFKKNSDSIYRLIEDNKD